MDYDNEQIIATYRERYAHLAESATLKSIEQHSYRQIVDLIDQAMDKDIKAPPSKKALYVLRYLTRVAQAVSEPEVKKIIGQCARDFNRDTGQSRKILYTDRSSG